MYSNVCKVKLRRIEGREKQARSSIPSALGRENKEEGITQFIRRAREAACRGREIVSFYGWLPIVLYNTFTLRPIIILYSECIVFLGRDNVSPTRQASTQSLTLSFPLSLAPPPSSFSSSPLFLSSLSPPRVHPPLFFPSSCSSSRFKQRSISYPGGSGGKAEGGGGGGGDWAR